MQRRNHSRIVIYLTHLQPASERVIAADLMLTAKTVCRILRDKRNGKIFELTKLGWRIRGSRVEEVIDDATAKWIEDNDGVTPEQIKQGTLEVQKGKAINKETGLPLPPWTERTFRKRAGDTSKERATVELQPVTVLTSAPRQSTTTVKVD